MNKRTIMALVALAFPVVSSAQQPAPDTTKPAPAASVSIPVDFSGVIYANYQYRGDAGAAKSANKFDLERAYLTFRMPAGASLRRRRPLVDPIGKNLRCARSRLHFRRPFP